MSNIKINVTVNTDDYGGFEKVGTFGSSLLQNNTQFATKPGDQEIRSFLNAGGGATDIVLSER